MIQPSFVSHEITGIGGGATGTGGWGPDAHAAHMMTRRKPIVAPGSRRGIVDVAAVFECGTLDLNTRPTCRIKAHTSHEPARERPDVRSHRRFVPAFP